MMQFKIEAEELVEVKNKIKPIVMGSNITKKTIYLRVSEDELFMYAYSEGNYGEARIPCYVKQDGFVELLAQSFDRFDNVKGTISFELADNQLLYDAPGLDGEINIVSSDPAFTEHPIPLEWFTLPEVVFSILYCTTNDDLNLSNVFFLDDIVAATAQVAFAGYKHPERLVPEPFTVPLSFFKLANKTEDMQVALGNKCIWFKSGEFYVSTQTVSYTNPIVAKLGYYEFDTENVPFFEITIEEAIQLWSYASAISEEGMAALVLNENILTIVPTGSEWGKGTMQMKCKSSYGQMNFGAGLRLFHNAITHVDSDNCKAYLVDGLVIVGHSTRHMFGEKPIARMKE